MTQIWFISCYCYFWKKMQFLNSESSFVVFFCLVRDEGENILIYGWKLEKHIWTRTTLKFSFHNLGLILKFDLLEIFIFQIFFKDWKKFISLLGHKNKISWRKFDPKPQGNDSKIFFDSIQLVISKYLRIRRMTIYSLKFNFWWKFGWIQNQIKND